MTDPVSKVFEFYAEKFGYKKGTFIFTCALDGLILKVGARDYLSQFGRLSGRMISEPSVDATKTPEE